MWWRWDGIKISSRLLGGQQPKQSFYVSSLSVSAGSWWKCTLCSDWQQRELLYFLCCRLSVIGELSFTFYKATLYCICFWLHYCWAIQTAHTGKHGYSTNVILSWIKSTGSSLSHLFSSRSTFSTMPLDSRIITRQIQLKVQLILFYHGNCIIETHGVSAYFTLPPLTVIASTDKDRTWYQAHCTILYTQG